MPTDRTLRSDALAGVVILVVDDNPDTVEVLVVALSMYGATVVGAASVAEALDALESTHPHLIISDINMPVEDGYALLARVRERTPERDGLVPVLAFTAFAGLAERRRIEAAGFEGLLAKPLAPDLVVGAIVRLLHLP